MTARQIRLAGATLLAAGSLGVLAACGDSDDDGGSSDKLAASCQAEVAVTEGFNKLVAANPNLTSEKPLTAAQKAQLQAGFDRYVAGPLNQISTDPPEDIKDEINTAVEAARKVRDGDIKTIQSPPVEQATSRVDAYFYDNCSGQKNAVNAIDFAFDGLNSTFKAGPTRFKMQNTGKDVHEMIIFRKKPGVTQSFAQLLKGDDTDKFVINVAGADPVPAGQSSYASANLTAGQYLAICFIPQGTTSLAKEGKGKPHYLLGMQKEFTVP